MNIDDYLNKTITDNTLNKINKNLFLTNYEINVLEKYNIDYKKCPDYNSLIYLIEEIEEDYEDLENISLSISERNYYQNTNK